MYTDIQSAEGAWITVDDLEKPDSPYAEDAIVIASNVLTALSGNRVFPPVRVLEMYELLPTSRITKIWLRGRPLKEVHHVYLQEGVGPGADPVAVPRSFWRTFDKGLLVLQSTQVYDWKHPSHPIYPPQPLPPADPSQPESPYQSWYRTCGNRPPVVTVDYTYGSELSRYAKLAAKALADQLILAADGSPECKLPEGVTSISRQGLSIQVYDPQDFISQGKTGIYEVDVFIRTVNPSNALLRARVVTPEVRARRLQVQDAVIDGSFAHFVGPAEPTYAGIGALWLNPDEEPDENTLS